jgi:hypothetical protein
MVSERDHQRSFRSALTKMTVRATHRTSHRGAKKQGNAHDTQAHNLVWFGRPARNGRCRNSTLRCISGVAWRAWRNAWQADVARAPLRTPSLSPSPSPLRTPALLPQTVRATTLHSPRFSRASSHRGACGGVWPRVRREAEGSAVRICAHCEASLLLTLDPSSKDATPVVPAAVGMAW